MTSVRPLFRAGAQRNDPPGLKTGRHREGKTARYSGGETGRDIAGKTGRYSGEKTGRDIAGKTGRYSGEKTGREIAEKTGRYSGEKTGRYSTAAECLCRRVENQLIGRGACGTLASRRPAP
jgi:hypothetical protein